MDSVVPYPNLVSDFNVKFKATCVNAVLTLANVSNTAKNIDNTPPGPPQEVIVDRVTPKQGNKLARWKIQRNRSAKIKGGKRVSQLYSDWGKVSHGKCGWTYMSKFDAIKIRSKTRKAESASLFKEDMLNLFYDPLDDNNLISNLEVLGNNRIYETNDQDNEQRTLKRAKTKLIQWLQTKIKRRGIENELSETHVSRQDIPKPTIKQTKMNNERPREADMMN